MDILYCEAFHILRRIIIFSLLKLLIHTMYKFMIEVMLCCLIVLHHIYRICLDSWDTKMMCEIVSHGDLFGMGIYLEWGSIWNGTVQQGSSILQCQCLCQQANSIVSRVSLKAVSVSENEEEWEVKMVWDRLLSLYI